MANGVAKAIKRCSHLHDVPLGMQAPMSSHTVQPTALRFRSANRRPHGRANFCLSRVALAAVCCGASWGSQAQTPSTPNANTDETIVITGSVVQRKIADAPYAIGVVDAEQLRSSGPMINLSEAMSRVPGLVVANRSNYAQDLQISSRGFGARAGFGVRGVRLYTDGIPASGPDGQGQVSHFDLGSAQRVEVLRGPFSVLYGNSSGGVIAAITQPVRERRFEAGFDVGSFGLRQLRIGTAAPLGDGFDLRASGAVMETDGFRPQSEAKKRNGQVRLGWQGSSDKVVALVNVLRQPADDPLGLTQTQFNANPRQTTAQATQFDTRKLLSQDQAGVNWRHTFANAGPLAESALSAYVGTRAVTGYLAIAAATQAAPRHGGGVVDFEREYHGWDARLTWRFANVDVVTGVASEGQRDDRRGYLNYTGPVATPTYGVIGTLRRNEVNRAKTNDAYVQADVKLADALSASAGVRGGKVKLSATDAFLSNGNDSGNSNFNYTNPVLGLRWQAASGLNLHASVARGFESPTLGELAYRPDGTGGFNAALSPQRSQQAELGAKWRSADNAWSVDGTLFRINVKDEISVATNAGGRQSFRNVGRTQRQGGELAATLKLTPQWRVQVAATLLDAKYRDAFLACAGIPCTAPTVPVASGNRIAGTQRGLGFAELAWKPSAASELGMELRVASGLVANDTNTDGSGRYSLLALRAQHRYSLGNGLSLDLLVRLDNALNKVHVGSVIVNDANGRYFEPGAPRNALLGLRLGKAF
jgi:iron complex outermembrane recepter protein